MEVGCGMEGRREAAGGGGGGAKKHLAPGDGKECKLKQEALSHSLVQLKR